MGKIARTSLTAALVMAATIVLSGCVPAKPVSTAAPLPAATPMFATDEEALAAATEAYAAYQRAMDLGFSNYDTTSVLSTTTGSAQSAALSSISEYKSSGKKQHGSTSVDTISLVNKEIGAGEIQIYLCLDVGLVDVVDSAGLSVVPIDRANRYPLIATLDRMGTGSSLTVIDDKTWSGNDFC